MRAILVFACLGLVPGISAAQPPQAPIGPPPKFVTVAAVDATKGQVDLLETLSRLVPETMVKRQEVNGEVQEVTFTVLRAVNMQRTLRHDLAKGEAFDAAGKKVASADLAKRLRVGAAVLVSADGQQVDAVYRNALAADTVILVSQQLLMPAPDGLPK